MKQLEFERLYASQWLAFADQLATLEHHPGQASSADFARRYRQVCHYHAICRNRHYSSFLLDQLGDLVVRGHAVLYQRKTHFLQAIIRFLTTEFPRQLRAEAKLFCWMSVFFYGSALAIACAQSWQPELIYSLMSPTRVQEMETMYAPGAAVVGEARESTTNWLMFGHYIQNNIGLAFRTFATGLIAGLGSLFFVIFNGLMLGAVATHLASIGSSTTFFTFVIGHGSFELTAIIIAGTAGSRLGLSLLQPGNMPRLMALRVASQSAITLVMGAMVMLLLAAFIEAFWSSNNLLMPWQKYGVGGLLWCLIFLYLGFAGRQRGY